MNTKKIIDRILLAFLLFGVFLIPSAIFNLSFLRFLLTNVPYWVVFGILSLIFSFTFHKNKKLGTLLIITGLLLVSFIIFVISILEKQDKERVGWNSQDPSFIVDFVVGRKGHIYIKATVNDTTGLFLFDTGAATSFVNEKFIANKQMKVTPFTIIDSKGIQQSKNLFKVKTFVLGGIEIRQLRVYPMDSITWIDPKGMFYKQDSIIGVIGNNIISKCIWDFDLMNKQIKVSKSKNYCSAFPDSLSVPLVWNNNGNKDIPVKVNGAVRMLTFDFGASEPLVLADSIPNSISADKSMFTSYSSGGLNHLDSTKKVGSNNYFVDAELGNYKFNEVLCSENEHYNLLGLPFIWAFERVVVDYLNDKAYFINENRNSEGRGKIRISRYNLWCNAREVKDGLIIKITNSKRNNGRYKFYGSLTIYQSHFGMDSIFYRDSLLLPNDQIEYGPATWVFDN